MLDAKDDEEEHKKVIRRDMDLNRREKRRAERMLKNKKLTPELVEMYLLSFSKKYRAIYECRMQFKIYAQGLYLGLNGSWTQRNANAIVFGASGAGKSRFFLKPNILQANGCFIVTDPSGGIMQGLGGFLKLMGYTVKCFNVQDMTESCRFNPLYYVRKTTDIPIIVVRRISKHSTGRYHILMDYSHAVFCRIPFDVCQRQQTYERGGIG